MALHSVVMIEYIGPRGPLAGDSPLVTGDLPCWLCFRRFQAAEVVTLCVFHPLDPNKWQHQLPPKTVAGRPTHWDCLQTFLGTPASAMRWPTGGDADRN